VEGYCLKCRKRLFGGADVPAMLSFKAPQNDNLREYQEQTKRLSISGVQLKYSLRLENKELVLNEDGGQYILKPIPPAAIVYADQAPENEHLTMQIAEQVFKIETAVNGLIYFADNKPAYITRRFDVKADGTKYLQEDFAQLSGKTKKANGDNFKYSGTYEDIGLLIKRHVAAAMPVLETFFRQVLFNYLISNGDAHLKNFSLILSDAGDYRLTPAYDLMSTIIHVPGETDTALDLFDGDTQTAYYQTYGHHGHADFMEFARRIGLIEARVARIIGQMVEQADKVTAMVNKSLLSDEVKEQYSRYFTDKVRGLQPQSA
jgi:serine/threonine-protein kinase HipA